MSATTHVDHAALRYGRDGIEAEYWIDELSLARPEALGDAVVRHRRLGEFIVSAVDAGGSVDDIVDALVESDDNFAMELAWLRGAARVAGVSAVSAQRVLAPIPVCEVVHPPDVAVTSPVLRIGRGADLGVLVRGQLGEISSVLEVELVEWTGGGVAG